MIDERRIGSCAGFAHDIIRLPSEARVDHDHEALLHDVMNVQYGVKYLQYNEQCHEEKDT